MDRRAFVKLTAGVLGALGVPSSGGASASTGAGTAARGARFKRHAALSEEYLAKGLTGMARAEGWFAAHWGAAVLAGYYLCEENELDEETVAAIRGQLDALLERRGGQFAPREDEPADEALIERVPQALPPVLEGGLRAHGHAVIFTALATKALRDRPELAQPSLIAGLTRVTGEIRAKTRLRKAEGPNARPYDESGQLVGALVDTLARFAALTGRPQVRRPNFTHMTTHTQALLDLEELGYADLARAGHPGHRLHVAEPVPEFDASQPAAKNPASFDRILRADFWRDETRRTTWRTGWDQEANPNGDWIAAGHLFKVLYAFARIAPLVDDPEQVRAAGEVLLERYFDPRVRGG